MLLSIFRINLFKAMVTLCIFVILPIDVSYATFGDRELSEAQKERIRKQIEGIETRTEILTTKLQSGLDKLKKHLPEKVGNKLQARLDKRIANIEEKANQRIERLREKLGEDEVDVNQNVAEGTVAFEDQFPTMADMDYNDFVGEYKIREIYNSSDELVQVKVDMKPIARGSADSHQIVMIIDGAKNFPSNLTFISRSLFVGDADIKVETRTPGGSLVSSTDFLFNDDIIVFDETADALPAPSGSLTTNTEPGTDLVEPQLLSTVTIDLKSPELNLKADRGDINLDLYRFVLTNKRTDLEVDTYHINPFEGMITANGYPFGMMIEDTLGWRYPLEGVGIETGYPGFADLRAELLNDPEDPLFVDWVASIVNPFDGILFQESDFN